VDEEGVLVVDVGYDDDDGEDEKVMKKWRLWILKSESGANTEQFDFRARIDERKR
jgi:hypothetical protein